MTNIGAPKGKYKRYYRFRDDNTKEVKSFEVGIDPTTLPIEPGYNTTWLVGMGPLAPEAYNNLLAAINEKVKNIPKSEETKRKMSLAKLGVPKSLQHRESMRIARLRVLAELKK